MSRDYDYERVRIEGRLVCLTPLAIGAGEMPTVTDTGPDREPSNRLAVCIGAGGLPYLPGSSLRGLLRALLPEDEARRHRCLFGSARGDGKDSRAGALRVYDAPLAKAEGGDKGIVDRPRTAIDPVTGTARDNCLYTLEQVPAGAEFRCEFEIERCDTETLRRFLGLLNLLDGSPLSRLGRGVGRSEGRVLWKSPAVKTLSPADLAAWLLAADKTLDECYEDQTKKLTAAPVEPVSRPEIIGIRLRLTSETPLLVDPIRYGKKGVKKKDGEPDLVCRTETRDTKNGDPKSVLVVPAASLRGLLRARCRKILLTLRVDYTKEGPPYDDAIRRADELLGRLFGTQHHASAVILEDAVAENFARHPQNFNAVDRFTGGVADTALYRVEAATAPYLETTLRIDPARLPKDQSDWWKGLLVLVLRDAMDGDLALGWGKSKGYGIFRARPKFGEGDDGYAKTWEDLAAKTGLLESAKDWVRALHEELNKQCP